MREIQPVLELVELLVEADRSAADLIAIQGCSVATIKRRIAEARDLGADIAAQKGAGGWVYQLRNAEAVGPRVRQWLELERDGLAPKC